MALRIGVDVGGTNTDAVLIDGRSVITACKTPTTSDVESGVAEALNEVLCEPTANVENVHAVMIGTTHFTNAFVERRSLSQVGILRIALPAARGIPPLVDWPDELADAIGRHVFMIRGGYQYDGQINAELDEKAVRSAAQQCRDKGIRSIAVCGLFSPVNSEMEERASRIVEEIIPDAVITLSSRIGRIGILARENAAIINASLCELAPRVIRSFRNALQTLKISAPLYISQNDGTLMSAEFAERYPVMTFSSGPTNSMRGAAYLCGVNDAIVVDIGGTTTDIGMLVNGFPREATIYAELGGVRTNIRMPDVLSLGLGGGSIVTRDPELRIGPQSVGFSLTEEALVFGGDTLTTSDVAVAAGYAKLGDAALTGDLDSAVVERAVKLIHSMIEDGIDTMKLSADPVPVILVGGGSILVGRDIPGTSEVIVPQHADVANAIGASIAQIGGEIDRMYSYEELGRDAAMEQAYAAARSAATDAGAIPGTTTIVDVEELPLAYIPGGTVRLRVKAVGELKASA